MTEIKYEDVRKGDLVSVVFEENGMKVTRTGRVHYPAYGYCDWRTSDGAYFGMDGRNVAITLLDRPVPPLPTKRGTVIKAKKIRGIEGEFTLYLNHNGVWASFQGVQSVPDGVTYYVHNSESIEDWEEMELVKK